MKHLLTSAIVAAIVSGGVLWLEDSLETDELRGDQPASTSPPSAQASIAARLSVSDALIEDTWVNASRTAGSDKRTLTNAADSVCYLTKVSISGVQGPEDANTCEIDIDEFTGFWQLTATVNDGGASEVRCNARCLSFETNESEP